jgi:hypothetical protein
MASNVKKEYLQKLADELNKSCDYKNCKDTTERLLAIKWTIDDLSFDKNEYRSYCNEGSEDSYYYYANGLCDSCNDILIEKIDNVFDKDINDIIIENILIKERIARLEALFSLR